MRYVLLILLAAVAALYFTLGIRIGLLNLTDTYLFNATGQSSYKYRTHESDQHIALTGTCDVRRGKVTLRFMDPKGTQLAGQECSTAGKFSLSLTGGGQAGDYTLIANYKNFSGHIKLDETRFGAR